jgi:hypothetical protein
VQSDRSLASVEGLTASIFRVRNGLSKKYVLDSLFYPKKAVSPSGTSVNFYQAIRCHVRIDNRPCYRSEGIHVGSLYSILERGGIFLFFHTSRRPRGPL